MLSESKISYRPLTAEDSSLRMKWLNDPEVNRYLGHQVRKGTDESFHRKWMEEYLAEKTREILIILADGKPIGQVGLIDINLLDKNAALYIVIGEAEYRGKGIGKEAIRYILDYAFNKMKLHRIWLEVHEDNIAGIKCYTDCGFIEEGHLVDQVLYADGTYHDEIGMAIINPKE